MHTFIFLKTLNYVVVHLTSLFCPGSWSVLNSGLLSTVSMWLVNCLVVAWVLARLFIYGEPVTSKNSEAAVAYWRHSHQAEQDTARVG